MDRVLTVCPAAQVTTSGKTRPMSRRSQTKSAHVPVSGANGARFCPAPKPTHAAKSVTWSATTHSNPRVSASAGPDGIPILDREAGRVLTALAAGRRRIVEVGTAYGYSTLCLALGQPADGSIVTIDPDRSRTERARGWWQQAGIPDA